MINFRADDELYSRLDRLARLTGRTKTFYVREAVTQYLADLEDAYSADRVIERLERREESTHDMDEVERDLGLED